MIDHPPTSDEYSDPSPNQTSNASVMWKRLQHMQTIQSADLESFTIPNPITSSIHRHWSLHNTVISHPNLESQSSLYGLKPSKITLRSSETTVGQTLDPLLDDFMIKDLLGEGGMGRVYSGVQASLNREVALKVSKVNDQEPRLIAQIFHEAQITANLDHPNILPIYILALNEQDQPIQVMKQIIGVTWADLIANPNHPMWSQLDHTEGRLHFHLDILAQVCQAMSYAHDHQIIHRDLKPENVMIGRFGEVFVLDWGVALYIPAIGASFEMTSYHAQVSSRLDEALVGTPAYMPKEMAQCDVASLGAWTDVYLLGAILYEILCGIRIRTGNNLKELFIQITDGIIPNIPPDISEEFRSLLLASLDPNIDHRIENGHSFRKLLVHAIRTDRAARVQRKAQRMSTELKQALHTEEYGVDELSFMYDEARLTYRTSLEMWSECTRARSGLDHLHSIWAEYSIVIDDLQGAKRAISHLEIPSPTLSQQLENAFRDRERLDQEHAQLQEWHADEQMSSSRSLRLLFSTIGLIIFGFGSLLLDYLERTDRVLIDSKGEFIAAISFTIIVYIIFAMIAARRRQSSGEANAIFQRLVSYLTIITLAVSLQRFISWQLGLSFDRLLHLEMTLIALGCFGLSVITGKKDFTWGGTAYAAASYLALLSPEITTTLYAGAMIILWLGVLMSAWLEGVDPSNSTPSL